MQLEQIWIYPVKSLPGIRLKSANVTPRGFYLDRHWMLVDADTGVFVTQRELPQLALISLTLHEDETALGLSADGQGRIEISAAQADNAGAMQVRVWNDSFTAQRVSDAADRWFSRLLGKSLCLVAMSDNVTRRVDQKYAGINDQTGFADGFPFLLLGAASIADLNRRIAADESMTVERFRPNLLISGSDAYAEDQWQNIVIGDIAFRVVKPCSRCSITTVDPATAETGREPLRTLAKYRRKGNQVYFGQNLLHNSSGRLHEGDLLQVISDV